MKLMFSILFTKSSQSVLRESARRGKHGDLCVICTEDFTLVNYWQKSMLSTATQKYRLRFVALWVSCGVPVTALLEDYSYNL